jgi:hypothetical protein
LFNIAVNDLDGITGIHMDLFTVNGDGMWDPGADPDRDVVEAFAPFSHDAEYIPEPSAALLFGVGALIVSGRTRRR